MICARNTITALSIVSLARPWVVSWMAYISRMFQRLPRVHYLPTLLMTVGRHGAIAVDCCLPCFSARHEQLRCTRVKTFLVANPDLRVDTQYKQGVYEAGSLKKGTQFPVSVIDDVLFVKDFRPDQDYLTRRLNDVMTCLRASFRERMGPIINPNRRFSRTFAIQTQANENQYSIKFDILLGSQLDSPGSFIPWPRWVRSYSVVDSLFYYTSTHSMLHIFRTYTT